MTAAERQKKLRNKRRSAGLCIACGKIRTSKYVRCDGCRAKHNLQSNDRKKRYTDHNKCRDCGTISLDFKLCNKCRSKAATSTLSTAHSRAANKCCKRCGSPSDTSHCLECKKKFKNERHNLIRETYEHYGGCRCACCGETEFLFLTIDHIDNDGAEHRRGLRYGKNTTGVNMARWLKKNNYPDGFQVLCMNCNFGKHRNGGICPHKQ